MRALRVPIRVVLYQDDGLWFAHCLEFDLLGHGRASSESLSNLADAVHSQVQTSVDYGNLGNLFKPADGQFFTMFAAGHDVVAADALRLNIGPVTIGEIALRQYEGTPALVAG